MLLGVPHYATITARRAPPWRSATTKARPAGWIDPKSCSCPGHRDCRARTCDVSAEKGSPLHTRLEASGTYAGHGLRGLDPGSAREQETYRVQPNELRALGTGECYVIHHGAAARVSVGLPAGAFGVSPVPAWLDQHPQDQAQLRPPVEPGQVR